MGALSYLTDIVFFYSYQNPNGDKKKPLLIYYKKKGFIEYICNNIFKIKNTYISIRFVEFIIKDRMFKYVFSGAWK